MLAWTAGGALVPAAMLLVLIGIEELAGGALLSERIALVAAGLTCLAVLSAPLSAAAFAWRGRGREREGPG